MHGPTQLCSAGRVAALALLMLLLMAAPAAANTFTVNDGGEGHDINPGDGVCDANEGPEAPCPLRAAVEEANAPPLCDCLNTADVINIDVPAVQLTLIEGGRLLITSNIQFNGVYSPQPTITQEPGPSGPGTGDRVFDIGSGVTVGIDNLTVRGGEANGSNNHFGGDIRSSGNLTITGSNIENGFGNSGGGVANVNGSLTIERSTVTGNQAPAEPFAGGDAGAILNSGNTDFAATLMIDSSTISGNSARLGGGITSGGNSGNSVTIANSTIAFNNSNLDPPRGGGGGLIIFDGTATIKNSIVAKNTSISPGQEDCSAGPGTIGSAGHNLEGATSCGFTSATDRQNADPALEPLAFNGGPTRTHALGAGSPAIDAGDPACPSADQRGAPRPQGPGCDIGACEALDQTPPDTTVVSASPGPTTDHTPTFDFSSG